MIDNFEQISKLLEEAKIKYPIGTIFNNSKMYPDSKNNRTIINSNFRWERCTKGLDIVVTPNEGGTYSVYSNGQWADIIEQSKDQEFKYSDWITFKYPSGNEYIGRFKEKKDNYIYTIDGTNYKKSSLGGLVVYSYYSDHYVLNCLVGLTTKEDIDKINKLTNKEVEFKIGDWVVVLNNNLGGKHKIGETYKIVSDWNNPKYGLIKPENPNNKWWYSDKCIRKALPHEIPNNKLINNNLLEIDPLKPTINLELPIMDYQMFEYKYGRIEKAIPELYQPTSNQIDTKLNKIESIKENLYQPSKSKLF